MRTVDVSPVRLLPTFTDREQSLVFAERQTPGGQGPRAPDRFVRPLVSQVPRQTEHRVAGVWGLGATSPLFAAADHASYGSCAASRRGLTAADHGTCHVRKRLLMPPPGTTESFLTMVGFRPISAGNSRGHPE